MKKLSFSIVIIFLSLLTSVDGQGEWTTEIMNAKKLGMGVAQLGAKVYFGGGLTVEGVTNLVEVYDVNTNTWSYSHLPTARNFCAAVASGSKVFFAGGMDVSGSTLNSIDILDVNTYQWNTTQLESPVFSLSAVAYDSIVLFAGGGDFTTNTESNVVKVYNTATGEWSSTFLSEARASMGATVGGDLAFFAGGLLFSNNNTTDKVDIYNFTTGTWTTDKLSEARFSVAATTVGNKVLFAGGQHADGSLSKRVDIYDLGTREWSIDSLSVARPAAGAATVCNKAYFVGGMQVNTTTNQIVGDYDEIDIYNEETGDWSLEFLPFNLFGHTTSSLGDHLLIGGGGTISGEFIQLRDEVRIFTCIPVSTSLLNHSPNLLVYPNPTSGMLYLDFQDNQPKIKVSIIDVAGKVLNSSSVVNADLVSINTDDLNEGVYIVQVQTKNEIGAFRFVVVK
mgnify:CR=1 FL=1